MIGKILAGLALAAIVLAVLFLWPVPVHSQVSSILLEWTAPGDDQGFGRATLYEGRWSTSRPDTTSQAALATWWAASATIAGLPVPSIAGARDSVRVASSFVTGTSYYFAVRACDEAGNCAAVSNVAVFFAPDVMPPGRIVDLKAR